MFLFLLLCQCRTSVIEYAFFTSKFMNLIGETNEKKIYIKCWIYFEKLVRDKFTFTYTQIIMPVHKSYDFYMDS